MKFTRVFTTVVCLLVVYTAGADSHRIKPLAEDFKVLYRTENPENTYVYDPGLAVCPNGRIIGCFSIGGPGAKDVEVAKGSGRGFVYISDDDGETWTYKTNFDMVHFRPFVTDERLYILGRRRDIYIISSDDWGYTWSQPVALTDGEGWHGSATNLWYKGDYVYLVMEKYTRRQMRSGWRVSELAPVLLRGDINTDLTKRENWTFSSAYAFADIVDDKELDWFGVPFYGAFYPEAKPNVRERSSEFPAGWLEANVVQITDPKHYWYDPTGRTFHIFMRAHTGVTNLACVIKAIEQEDGSIETKLIKAPSGKKHLYVPFPGGQMKFSIVYDEQTKLYWMVSTQSTDSMTKAEMLPKERFRFADNERRRLVLHFSKNMIDWVFAGVVSIGPVEKASRHYPQMVIKDDDLLIMSRSGSLKARSAHNGDMATFHRVKNFRSLVY